MPGLLPGITLGYDATHANVSRLPRKAQVAGYDTGSGDVPWTPKDYALFTNPLHICQEAGFANPVTSDYIDLERFAATVDDAVAWWPHAHQSFLNAERPGQRYPAVYLSADNVPALVARFREVGITGVALVIANWSITENQSELEVLNSIGTDFPVVGAQFAAGQFYDVDVYLTSWLDLVSGPAPKLFTILTKPGDTFLSVADSRDANLRNLIMRTVAHSTQLNFLKLGQAVLVPGTEITVVNP